MTVMQFQFAVTIDESPKCKSSPATLTGAAPTEFEAVVAKDWIQNCGTLAKALAGRFQHFLPVKREAADVPVDGEEGAVGGEDTAAAWEEGQAHERRTAEEVFGVTLWSDANDAAASAE